jgi:hypothetical protein
MNKFPGSSCRGGGGRRMRLAIAIIKSRAAVSGGWARGVCPSSQAGGIKPAYLNQCPHRGFVLEESSPAESSLLPRAAAGRGPLVLWYELQSLPPAKETCCEHALTRVAPSSPDQAPRAGPH